MNRSPMKRGKGLKRTGFSLGARREPKTRKPINKVGKEAKRENKAKAAFQETVLLNAFHVCERCLDIATVGHHMCLKSRCRGHADRHNAEMNGAALCEQCHITIHRDTPEDLHDWSKPVRWLDAGGRLNETPTPTN